MGQAELRWRIRRDLTGLTLENALPGTGTTRDAERHFAPWLKQAAATLDTPMSIEGLEDIIAQWRGRRAPYMLANPDWPDVIIAPPIPRTRPSWWWILTRGEYSPVPYSSPTGMFSAMALPALRPLASSMWQKHHGAALPHR
ncbi:hypothetical protein I1A62_04950 (plasmid) [Rhodococcus sp. USK10]|uniref:hypothetical protein n=1 Tax=Rhodococcus sp. USK10 TaxID=2789739 RepID=UPI001C6029AB|nr:hypothetical protein [Rhodococcus sp. USK10]QYB00368.1 hypothetical protein I1A62_04950 [Rhodococcus sp. USK10]